MLLVFINRNEVRKCVCSSTQILLYSRAFSSVGSKQDGGQIGIVVRAIYLRCLHLFCMCPLHGLNIMNA
jgi:hypothetical protein